jgi:hypothetical protein
MTLPARFIALGAVLITGVAGCITTTAAGPDDVQVVAARSTAGAPQLFTGTCQLEYSGLYCNGAGCASHPVDSQPLGVKFTVSTDASGAMSVDGSVFAASYPTATDQAWLRNAANCMAGTPEDVQFPATTWTGYLRCSSYLEVCTVASQGDCEGLSFQGQTQPDGTETLTYSYVANATGGIGGYVTIDCTARSADACNNTCAPTQVCNGGTCGCAGNQTSCGEAPYQYCTDTSSDIDNCGACGHGCNWGQACVAGACTCPGGQTACGSACVDTSSDRNDCGACGNACGSGQVCTQGACVCQTGMTVCGGACVYTAYDDSNCGSCGTVCPSGTRCDQGWCI